MHDLLLAAVDVNWRNLALGHEVFEADGATFVRNTAFPSIYDANFMFNAAASTPGQIECLLERARREYAHASKLTFRLDAWTPPAFEARLALDGYDRSDSLLFVLEGAVRGKSPKPVDIRPIKDDAGWDAFRAMKRSDWAEHAARIHEDPSNMAIPDGLAGTSRLKGPPVRYFLAFADGAPVGFFNAWEGSGGVGQVEDLFVLPAFRRRGFATALIHHCVADARAHGAGPVVIVADPTDTPKNIYAAMGWQPAAVTRQWSKANAPGRALPGGRSR
jgi:GNAT superfamily N-acetyltransferase